MIVNCHVIMWWLLGLLKKHTIFKQNLLNMLFRIVYSTNKNLACSVCYNNHPWEISGSKKYFFGPEKSKQFYHSLSKNMTILAWFLTKCSVYASFSREIRTTFQTICWNCIIAWWYAENELTSVLRMLIMMSETITNLYYP